jgi:nucleoside-diphosphate-sugar epimerase
MELKGTRVLVTGATGFIGSHLVERLATVEGARVRTLSRSLNRSAELKWVAEELVQCDVTDPRAVRHAVRGCQLIFHCAGLVHDFAAPMESFRQVNVEGTRNVLEAALEAGVERVVHLSSIAVYGIDPKDGTNEDQPYRPCGMPYFDTKIEAERVADRLFKEHGLPLVVIRPANVYGPGSPLWTLGLVAMIKSGQVTLIDKGRGMSNHLYIDNLVDALILAARNDHVIGQSFIISDDARTDWKEFLGHYVSMLGLEPLPSISKGRAYYRALLARAAAPLTGRAPELTPDAIRLWTQTGTFDIGRAKARLSYEPRISLDQGMRSTEKWLRQSGHLA